MSRTTSQQNAYIYHKILKDVTDKYRRMSSKTGVPSGSIPGEYYIECRDELDKELAPLGYVKNTHSRYGNERHMLARMKTVKRRKEKRISRQAFKKEIYCEM